MICIKCLRAVEIAGIVSSHRGEESRPTPEHLMNASCLFVSTVIDSCGFETECSANSLSRIALEIAAAVEPESKTTYRVWNSKTEQLAGYVTVHADGSHTWHAV